MKCIGFAYVGGIWNPSLGRKDVVGSAMAPFERAMVVSYRLSIVTVALSVTTAAICDRMSPTLKSTGRWNTLGQNLRVFPLVVDTLEQIPDV